MIEQVLIHIVIFLALGSFAGVISGLFGVGGGVIVVPTLAAVFAMDHFSTGASMHMAAGTSLAVMVVSMLRALFAHRHYQVEYWSIFRRWLVPVIVGVVLGTVVAHHLSSRALTLVFGVFIFFCSLKLLLPLKGNKRRALPATPGMSVVGLLIGSISAMLGIGGGALTVPFLAHCNIEMRRAVIISTAVGMTIATIGTIMVILTGLHQKDLPTYSIGYIYWPAWFGIVVGSLIFVPVGTALSHRMPDMLLKRLLAMLLLAVGIHLVWRVIHAQ